MLNSSTANWTVGQKVWYQCDVGYKGKSFAACDVDGQWKLNNSGSDCVRVGCGTFEKFLLNTVGHDWSKIVSVREAALIHNASLVGDVINLTCQKGYRGK